MTELPLVISQTPAAAAAPFEELYLRFNSHGVFADPHPRLYAPDTHGLLCGRLKAADARSG